MGVVFSEASQEIYELNTTATYIWCQLEEGAQHPKIADDLAKTFGFGKSEAQRYVNETLNHWAALGLMGQQATAREEPVLQEREAQIHGPGEMVVLPQGGSNIARYDILGQRFRVGFETDTLKAWVCPALTHLEVSEVGADEIAIEIYADGPACNCEA